MHNGWFRGNDNTLIMRSGKEVKFRSLTISSTLTIPESSNLDLETEYMDVTLGTLNGTANLDLNGSFFTAKYVQQLNAKLRNSELKIDKVEGASVSAHNSRVMLLTAKQVEIGKLLFDNRSIGFDRVNFDVINEYFRPKPLPPADKSKDLEGKYSSTNKYTLKNLKKLEVYSSLNDKFSINEIDELKLMDVAFSEFDISKLMKKVYGQFDFGELNIYSLDKSQFENVILTSSFGSLRIFSQEADNLRMVVKNISKTKERFLEALEFNLEDNVKVGPDFKVCPMDNQSEFSYKKGSYKGKENQKGLIHLTCDFCDLYLN